MVKIMLFVKVFFGNFKPLHKRGFGAVKGIKKHVSQIEKPVYFWYITDHLSNAIHHIEKESPQ